MKELPENQTIARQINEKLTGKTITGVFNATKYHKQTFFYGDPLTYGKLLIGRKIKSSESYGMYVDILLNNQTKISFGDGTNIKYVVNPGKMPDGYQLLLTLDDNSYLIYTVGMFGLIAAYKGAYDGIYYQKSYQSISPLSKEFDEKYFDDLFTGLRPKLSAKLFLASEQRIPGLGNGVLQDILFNARINPKRQISTFTDADKSLLFQSVKQTLSDMTEQGGRDIETDLSGNRGGYKCILSKNTVNTPCPRCGDTIVKEASSGGSVYYCPTCQL